MTPGKVVLVAGIGGNIGSHLAPHLARMPEIRSLTLIDRDHYEPRNRANQVGVARGAKATVQARRVRRENPALEVTSHVADLERLPLGLFRVDLLISCVDNRRARLHLNQVSRWLGVPWLDAGVLADGGYARVTRFGADPAGPCLTCSWGPRDYALVEQSYPCRKGTSGLVPPTGASSALGALAAALAALECRRVLQGDPPPNRPTDFVVASECWQATATRWVRNPACRTEHARRPIEAGTLPLDANLTSAALGRAGGGANGTVSVVGGRFARELICRRCRSIGCPPRLVRTGERTLACPRCGRPADVVGFGLEAELDLGTLAGAPQATPEALGCLPGDVLAFSTDSSVRFFEVSQ